MQGLTQRQQMVLDFIRQSIHDRGYPPTLREIGARMGIRSTNGVNDHLRALERKGYLTREDMKSRALRPTNLATHDLNGSGVLPEPAANDVDLVEVPVLGRVAAGLPLLAEEQAREALTILDARDDYLEERGNVTLVLGRALLEQDRTDAALTAFVDAEQLFQRLGLQSQLAAAWTAQADAWLRRDESRRAALLYRRAVEAIQDFHF